MEDKELLELAAKAAGLKPTENCNGQLAWTTGIGSGCLLWNPLTDDGDALRLAVKTGMAIDSRYRIPSAQRHNGVTYWASQACGIRVSFDRFNGDPMTACRRAIVRAAAEIGRAMP